MIEVYLQALHQFAATAEAFCTLLENHIALSDEDFTKRCASALAALYRDALALPDIHDLPKLEEDCEGIGAIHQRNFFDQRVYDSLIERFASHNVDLHWLYSNPFDPESSITARVSSDLDEIYTDMRKGLALYGLKTECALLYAAFEWQLGVASHWGYHLTHALAVLHQIFMDDQAAKIGRSAQAAEDDDE